MAGGMGSLVFVALNFENQSQKFGEQTKTSPSAEFQDLPANFGLCEVLLELWRMAILRPPPIHTPIVPK